MTGPEPLLQLPGRHSPPASPPVGQPSRRWAMLGAAALLTGAAAAVHYRAANPGPDEVDPAEAARRLDALNALGALPLAAVPAGDMAAALAASGLPASGVTAVMADAAAGRVRIVLLSLFDSDVEDGDVAEIRSGGWSRVVRLARAPVALAVPVGADNTISVAGLVDGGGGGVTVGLVLPSGPLPLPPLSVGQVLRLPVFPFSGPVR